MHEFSEENTLITYLLQATCNLNVIKPVEPRSFVTENIDQSSFFHSYDNISLSEIGVFEMIETLITSSNQTSFEDSTDDLFRNKLKRQVVQYRGPFEYISNLERLNNEYLERINRINEELITVQSVRRKEMGQVREELEDLRVENRELKILLDDIMLRNRERTRSQASSVSSYSVDDEDISVLKKQNEILKNQKKELYKKCNLLLEALKQQEETKQINKDLLSENQQLNHVIQQQEILINELQTQLANMQNLESIPVFEPSKLHSLQSELEMAIDKHKPNLRVNTMNIKQQNVLEFIPSFMLSPPHNRLIASLDDSPKSSDYKTPISPINIILPTRENSNVWDVFKRYFD